MTTSSYADYSFYTETYLGNAIAEADFPRLAMRASSVIDQITYGRSKYEMQSSGGTVQNPDLVPPFPYDPTVQHIPQNPDFLIPQISSSDNTELKDLIKMAVCAVAEELLILSKNENGGEIASERVGNCSTSYVENSSLKLSDQAKLQKAARLYLATTGLLYKGMLHEDQWQSNDL